jgi:rRNA maturation endonuclease Nob1
MTPEYRCMACGARFSFDAVRHIARCRDCGSGLWREPEGAAGRDEPHQVEREEDRGRLTAR